MRMNKIIKLILVVSIFYMVNAIFMAFDPFVSFIPDDIKMSQRLGHSACLTAIQATSFWLGIYVYKRFKGIG